MWVQVVDPLTSRQKENSLNLRKLPATVATPLAKAIANPQEDLAKFGYKLNI